MLRVLLGVTVLLLGSEPLFAQSGADWPTFGMDSGGSQYSPLDQVTAENLSS